MFIYIFLFIYLINESSFSKKVQGMANLTKVQKLMKVNLVNLGFKDSLKENIQISQWRSASMLLLLWLALQMKGILSVLYLR